MKKAIVIIFCTLLFGCSTKIKYENWQVPFEEVDTAYIYNYDDNESQYKEITHEEANQLLKAYNQIKYNIIKQTENISVCFYFFRSALNQNVPILIVFVNKI